MTIWQMLGVVGEVEANRRRVEISIRLDVGTDAALIIRSDGEMEIFRPPPPSLLGDAIELAAHGIRTGITLAVTSAIDAAIDEANDYLDDVRPQAKA